MIPKIVDGKGNPLVPMKSVTVRMKLSDWGDPKKIRDFIAMLERETRAASFVTANDQYMQVQLFVKEFDAAYWKNVQEANNVEVFVSDSSRM